MFNLAKCSASAIVSNPPSRISFPLLIPSAVAVGVQIPQFQIFPGERFSVDSRFFSQRAHVDVSSVSDNRNNVLKQWNMLNGAASVSDSIMRDSWHETMDERKKWLRIKRSPAIHYPVAPLNWKFSTANKNINQLEQSARINPHYRVDCVLNDGINIPLMQLSITILKAGRTT